MALDGPVACLPLRELPQTLQETWRHTTGRDRCLEPTLPKILRSLYGPGEEDLASLGRHCSRERSAIRIRGQSWWRTRHSKRPEAVKPGGGVVQCGSSGPLGRNTNLGLRTAGARRVFGHAGPYSYERLGSLQQFPANLAARVESASGVDALACTDHGKRHGALVPLAGRFSRRYALAGGGSFIFCLARCKRSTFS